MDLGVNKQAISFQMNKVLALKSQIRRNAFYGYVTITQPYIVSKLHVYSCKL